VRLGRWRSPAGRADALMHRDLYADALALCDRALAVEGPGAWIGARRLVWLNRRTSVLLAMGRADEAARTALEALDLSADPETLGNCSLALLRLNLYDDTLSAARLALSLTRERSMLAHATLASVVLVRGMPAEAEALARAGTEDARALLPLVRQEHYVLCLAALCRAARGVAKLPLPPHRAKLVQARAQATRHYLEELRVAAKKSRHLKAIAQAEEAESLSELLETRERAFAELDAALQGWPDYVLWLIAQPGTFAALRGDERFALLAAKSAERLAKLRHAGPTAQTVTASLAAATQRARPRPARQASSLALVTQVITLSSTFALLLLWTWRFFIAVS
jgi:tetratricopeptide (TPR) repeat protein